MCGNGRAGGVNWNWNWTGGGDWTGDWVGDKDENGRRQALPACSDTRHRHSQLTLQSDKSLQLQTAMAVRSHKLVEPPFQSPTFPQKYGRSSINGRRRDKSRR